MIGTRSGVLATREPEKSRYPFPISNLVPAILVPVLVPVLVRNPLSRANSRVLVPLLVRIDISYVCWPSLRKFADVSTRAGPEGTSARLQHKRSVVEIGANVPLHQLGLGKALQEKRFEFGHTVVAVAAAMRHPFYIHAGVVVLNRV